MILSIIQIQWLPYPIGSMYGIYANIGGILMVNVTIYSIHGSYGYWKPNFHDIHPPILGEPCLVGISAGMPNVLMKPTINLPGNLGMVDRTLLLNPIIIGEKLLNP